jgi:hypothetical protein
MERSNGPGASEMCGCLLFPFIILGAFLSGFFGGFKLD